MLEERAYVAVDLAELHDFTAYSVLEVEWYDVPMSVEGEQRPAYDARVLKPVFNVTHIERAQQIPYRQLLERSQQILRAPRLYGKAPQLILDATGVGQPVVEMAEEMALEPVPIVITSGHTAHQKDGWYYVPRKVLISAVVVALQSGQVRFAEGLELRPQLVKELMNLRVKTKQETGVESFEGWRDSVHDDIVLSVAMAVWRAGAEHKQEILTADKLSQEVGDNAPEWNVLEWGLT